MGDASQMGRDSRVIVAREEKTTRTLVVGNEKERWMDGWIERARAGGKVASSSSSGIGVCVCDRCMIARTSALSAVDCGAVDHNGDYG